MDCTCRSTTFPVSGSRSEGEPMRVFWRQMVIAKKISIIVYFMSQLHTKGKNKYCVIEGYAIKWLFFLENKAKYETNQGLKKYF